MGLGVTENSVNREWFGKMTQRLGGPEFCVPAYT